MRRIFITRMAVHSAAGSTLPDFWENLLSGRSFIGPITKFDAGDFPVKVACEIPTSNASIAKRLSASDRRRMPEAMQYGMYVADEVMRYYEDLSEAARGRLALITGTCFGGITQASHQLDLMRTKGPRRLDPFFAAMTIPNAIGGAIAIKHRLPGPNVCISTACAAGTHAIGHGFRLIQSGEVDRSLAVSADAMIVPLAVASFWRVGALSESVDLPDRVSRPFDVDRTGFVLGEGAAAVMLESEDVLTTEPLAEVLGFGAACDAYHPTSPPPDGAGAKRVMIAALDDARTTPEAVVHVNAHGTGTRDNDIAEGRAIGSLFEDYCAVTSIKGSIGHAIGAAGGIEMIATVLTKLHGMIPPTVGHTNLDPELALNVCTAPTKLESGDGILLSNSFAIGGQSACLAIR